MLRDPNDEELPPMKLPPAPPPPTGFGVVGLPLDVANQEFTIRETPKREKNLTDWQQEIMAWAESKGWNQGLNERSFGDWMALLHSEISEAYEDYREHRDLNEIYYEIRGEKVDRLTRLDLIENGHDAADFKPCGIPIEIADLAIRMLHLAEFAGFNLNQMIALKMEYNKTRSHRHGNKKV